MAITTIIEARVIQKVATEQEWNETDLLLYQGEAAYVSDKFNFKLNTQEEPKRFSELEYYYKGDVVGTVTTTEDLSLKSDGVYYAQTSGTYAGVVVREGYYTLLRKNNGVWSIASEVKMPEYDDTLLQSRVSELESKNSVTINKGKSYPYVNQTSSTAVNNLNNVILNVEIDEVSHQDNLLFSITLIARNVIANDWGNALHFRVLNASDLSQNTSFVYKSTDANISADILKELNKISASGIQTLSIYNANYNKWFYITIDADAIADNQLIDASYTNINNKMFFSNDVYKVITNTNVFATKTELNATNTNVSAVIGRVSTLEQNNSLTINKGKPYPFLNQPTDAVITTVNNSIIDAKIYGGDYDNYTYSIVGLYKNQATFGNGVVIARTRKIDNIRGYQYIYDADRTQNTSSIEQRKEVSKIAKGGIQTIELKMVQVFGGFDIKIVLDTTSIPDGNTNFGTASTETKWINHIINPSNYLQALSTSGGGSVDIPTYETFKDALKDNATGVINIGQNLVKSIVEIPTSSGDTSNYYPSQIGKQYAITNTQYSEPKSMSEIITIKNEDGTDAIIKSFGKRYIYFGNSNVLYRTQEELRNKVNTHLNTQYEKLVLPQVLPDSYRNTNASIMNAFELDNGELLIEVRNGVKENEADDYRGHRTQLYLTNGFKSLTPTMNVDNILEYNLEGIVSRVWQYKAWTTTVGKVGTTVSIVNNVICISPYYIGKVGLVFVSRDFGKTWKTIFNMGVEDDDFAVSYKGSTGAYPLPENLNPPMPADMWTAGGNTNFHTHGVTYDPIYNRIWVSTGDAGTNYQGRTALWYSDDDGVTWVRMQTKNTNLLDSPSGIQPMGVVVSKDYVLVGTDSATDGLYRYSRSERLKVPKLEAVYWYKDTYSNIMRVIYGGSVLTREGYIYSVFFPNTPTDYSKGVVSFTIDGINFKEVYFDEINTETSSSPRNLDWGTFIGQDRFGNIYVPNSNGKIIKLY